MADTSTFDEAADAQKYAKENDWKGSSLSQTIFIPSGTLCWKFLKIVEFKCRWQGGQWYFYFELVEIWSWNPSYFSETIKYPLLLWDAEPEVVSNH